MSTEQIYIHYGATAFDPLKNFPIKNDRGWSKPKGGLWASRVNATFGWKDWCEQEDFRDCSDDNSFRFIMEDESKIARISNFSDLMRLPQLIDPIQRGEIGTIYILGYMAGIVIP